MVMGTKPAKISDIWGNGRKVIHMFMDGSEEFVADVGGRRAAPAGTGRSVRHAARARGSR